MLDDYNELLGLFWDDSRMNSGPPDIKWHCNFPVGTMVQNNCGGFMVQPRIGGGYYLELRVKAQIVIFGKSIFAVETTWRSHLRGVWGVIAPSGYLGRVSGGAPDVHTVRKDTAYGGI